MFSFKVIPKQFKSYTSSIDVKLFIIHFLFRFFFTFSDNLFKLSHSHILLSSLVISVSTVSLGFMDLIDCSEADRFVSSAYIML